MDDAACFWQIGILWRLMASGIKTANALCFLDETVGGEAGGPVTHAHPTDEGFYVIDGRCAFYAGGKTIDAGPGTFVAIPRYTPHAFLAEPGSRLLNWYLPAGFELLLLGLALPAERNEAPPPPPPGRSEVAAAAAGARSCPTTTAKSPSWACPSPTRPTRQR